MKVGILILDDWNVLYVDNKKRYEDHSIRDEDYTNLLEELGAEVTMVWEDELPTSLYEKFASGWGTPDTWEELQEMVEEYEHRDNRVLGY